MKAVIEFCLFKHKCAASKVTVTVSKQIKTIVGDVNLNGMFRIYPVSDQRLRKMTWRMAAEMDTVQKYQQVALAGLGKFCDKNSNNMFNRFLSSYQIMFHNL